MGTEKKKTTTTKAKKKLTVLSTHPGAVQQTPARPVLVGETVYWAWMTGVLCVEAAGEVRFRTEVEPGQLFDVVPRVLHADGRLAFSTSSPVQGVGTLRILDEAGRVLSHSRIAKLEHLLIHQGRLLVFTRHVPLAENVTSAQLRVAELGVEGALRNYRQELISRRSAYTEAGTLFGDGAVLEFDLQTGAHVATRAFGAPVARKAVFGAGELVVTAPVDQLQQDPGFETTSTTSVHRADGATVWTLPRRLLAASAEGVLLSDDEGWAWLAVEDGSERWRIKAPLADADPSRVHLSAGAVVVAGDYAHRTKSRSLQAFSLATGKRLWAEDAGVGSSPSDLHLADGVLWLSNEKLRPQARSLETGEVLIEAPKQAGPQVVGHRTRCAAVSRDGASLVVSACEL